MKNLNNVKALELIKDEVNLAPVFEGEKVEVTINLIVESDATYTMTANIEVEGSIVSSFPIGKKYTERGAIIKADQLISKLVGNVIQSAGWKKINLDDLFKDMDEEALDEEKSPCPSCNGTGEYYDVYDDQFGNSMPHIATCEYCEGEGKVDMKEIEESMARAEEYAKEFLRDEIDI